MIKYYTLTLLTAVLFITPAIAQNSVHFSDIKPGMKDGRIERDAIKIANQRAVDLRCPEDYYKAKILSYDWITEKDKRGAVCGRKIHIELYCQFPDGHCGMADLIFRQRLLGNGEFSRKLQFEKMGDMFTVDCEP